MTHPVDTLRAQLLLVRAQRTALRLRAAQTVERLAPAVLAKDALDAAEAAALETADRIKAHPFTAAGVILGLAALTFHRPLSRAIIDAVAQWLPHDDGDTDGESAAANAVEPDPGADR